MVTIKKYQYERADRTILRWQWNSRFAYDGVIRLGATDDYRCWVMHRIACWLSGLGVPFRMEPEIGKCLMHLNGECKGEIHLDCDAVARR